jgi:Uncharacterized conserved protein
MLGKFKAAFRPMDNLIDNYLFQLPPNIKSDKADNILKFISDSNITKKAVVEPRSTSWFNDTIYSKFKEGSVTMCSIDSPIGSFFVKTTEKVYLRLHGRKSWYTYNYSRNELEEIIRFCHQPQAKRGIYFLKQ